MVSELVVSELVHDPSWYRVRVGIGFESSGKATFP